ncbi:MAG: radical SAM protein [Candidatus Diapherotrites archaeon]
MGYIELMRYSEKACIPISAIIELTNKCNQDCVMCYNVQRHEKELTTAEAKSAIRQLEKLGCLFLTFTGGEVLARADFFEIACYARKRGFGIRILTNGTLIDEEAADKLASLSPLSVEISLFSLKPEIHDGITRTPGSLERTIEAMRLLKKRRVKVVAKSTFMKQNAGEFAPLKEHCRKKKITFSHTALVTPKNDGSLGPCKFRLSDRELAEWHADRFKGSKTPILRRIAERENNKEPIYLIGCYAGRNTCRISPYGDVSPCIELGRIWGGNIRERSLKEIWHNSEAFKQLRETGSQILEACTSCRLKSYCITCPGLRMIEGGGIDMPLRESCRQARIHRLAVRRALAANEKNNKEKSA